VELSALLSFVRRLVAVATLALALASGIGFFGGLSWVADLFAHFRLQLAVGLLVCVAAAWVLRQSGVALLAASCSLVNLVVVSPQLVYQPSAEARGERTVRLVHANVNYFNRDFESALRFFSDADPDVLLIVEANELWMSALAPLRERLVYTKWVQDGKFQIAMMSRFPMTAAGKYFSPRNPSIVAHVDAPGGELCVIGTHPRSPASSRRARRRDQQLASIGAFVRQQATRTVVVGDLNTTPWGHAFRALVLDSGLRDSSRGFGFQWSWPASFWPLGIPIDHALVSDGVNVLDRRMGPSIGSDHLPLVVDIQLTETVRGSRLPES
jgi:endonuclease/exonuclease/phosphatase (EEP) superfamily protein YafD